MSAPDPLESLSRRVDEWDCDEARENDWRLRAFLLVLVIYLVAEMWL
jgi:hypothetical protein